MSPNDWLFCMVSILSFVSTTVCVHFLILSLFARSAHDLEQNRVLLFCAVNCFPQYSHAF